MVYKLSLFSICLLISCSIIAQDGSLDTSFADNGFVDIDYGNSSIDIGGVNQLSDGSYIILAGKLDSNNKSILIHKFLNDGTLDGSFGNNGILNYLPIVREDPRATYTVEEDKILYIFSKEAQGNFFKRFLPDGTVDTSFGSNGELNPFPGEFGAQLLFNKFNQIVAGLNSNGSFQIKRFLMNGDLDSSFGNGGTVFIQKPTPSTQFQTFTITSNDKILITAFQEIDSEEIPVMFRVNQDGTIDSGFGDNGFIEIPFVDPNDEFASVTNSLRLFEDGSILIVSLYFYPLDDFASTRIYKLSSDGEIITTIGSGGEIVESGLPRVIIQENQRILAVFQPVGMVFLGGPIDVKRYFSDGFVDPSLSYNREDFPDLYESNFIIDTDGKIVVVGSKSVNFGSDLLAFRLNNNVLGVQENTRNNFTVSPNPTNDFITISCASCSLTNKNYQITDATGKVLRQAIFDIETPMVSMEGFAAGLYYVTIEATTLKILKK